jgi:hypothetical protein
MRVLLNKTQTFKQGNELWEWIVGVQGRFAGILLTTTSYYLVNVKIAPLLKWASYQEEIGGGSTAVCILNLGSRWRWVMLLTLHPLTSGEESPVIWGSVGPEAWLDVLEKKKSPTLLWSEPQSPSLNPSDCFCVLFIETVVTILFIYIYLFIFWNLKNVSHSCNSPVAPHYEDRNEVLWKYSPLFFSDVTVKMNFRQYAC